MKKLLKALRSPQMGNTLYISVVAAVLLAVSGLIAPGFLAFSNLMNLMRQAAP